MTTKPKQALTAVNKYPSILHFPDLTTYISDAFPWQTNMYLLKVQPESYDWFDSYGEP